LLGSPLKNFDRRRHLERLRYFEQVLSVSGKPGERAILAEDDWETRKKAHLARAKDWFPAR
jgi:hypothetical protein